MMGETKMARVIGIDFGNWNAFTCFIDNMDAETRMGGTIIDLIPDRYRELGQNGVPNEFFWAKSGENGAEREYFGFEAAKDSNYPVENHLRLLKRNMGKKITLYGDIQKTNSREFDYDDLIVKAFSYVVSLANESLREAYGESGTTNLISVTYPASISDPSRLRYLVDLAEKADSGAMDEKGNMLKIKVVGTTCEPAAAGLDRLSEQRENTIRDVETFGVCDFGGGTYDLSIVALYPRGRRFANNTTYYYDIVCDGEGANIGGNDLTNILEDLFNNKLKEEIGREPSAMNKRLTKRNVERCKIELSSANVSDTTITYEVDDDIVEIHVDREEFEKAIAPKVSEVVKMTREFFNRHADQRPDSIIMTGGTFYIPYIQEQLKAALPEFAGNIYPHKPSKAAAHGAARFYNPVPARVNANPVGQESPDTDVTLPPIVRRTLSHDITTRIVRDGNMQMNTLIARGSVIPCDSGERTFVSSVMGAETTDYNIYIANKTNPNPSRISEDYDLIEEAVLHHPNEPIGEHVRTWCTLSIDSLGTIRMKAWTKNNESIEVEHNVNLNEI